MKTQKPFHLLFLQIHSHNEGIFFFTTNSQNLEKKSRSFEQNNSDPLFSDSKLTKQQAFYLIMRYFLKHKLIREAKEEFLQIIKCFFSKSDELKDLPCT